MSDEIDTYNLKRQDRKIQKMMSIFLSNILFYY